MKDIDNEHDWPRTAHHVSGQVVLGVRRIYAKPMHDDTANRDEACACASSDWNRAMAITDLIEESWFRIQALAKCARHAPTDAQADDLIERAWGLATGESDRFNTVSVSAWIIDAALHRGMGDRASIIVASGLAMAEEITPLKSRCRALSHVWQSALPMGAEISDPILRAAAQAAFELLSAEHPSMRGIGRSELRHLILTAVSCAPLVAEELLQRCPSQAHADRLRARIAAGERSNPRTHW